MQQNLQQNLQQADRSGKVTNIAIITELEKMVGTTITTQKTEKLAEKLAEGEDEVRETAINETAGEANNDVAGNVNTT